MKIACVPSKLLVFTFFIDESLEVSGLFKKGDIGTAPEKIRKIFENGMVPISYVVTVQPNKLEVGLDFQDKDCPMAHDAALEGAFEAVAYAFNSDGLTEKVELKDLLLYLWETGSSLSCTT
jgi:hypothetical protein